MIMVLRDVLKVVCPETDVIVKVKDLHDIFSILYDTVPKHECRKFYNNEVEQINVSGTTLFILVEVY